MVYENDGLWTRSVRKPNAAELLSPTDRQMPVAGEGLRENFMNMKSAALALTLAIVTCVPARAKTILPDACGDNKVGFEIKTKRDQPQPGAPEPARRLSSSSDVHIPTLQPSLRGAFWY
jgi:hypothetical protein